MNLRLDRLATLYLFNPLKRGIGAAKPSIPILMYHNISDDSESYLHPYYQTGTSPLVFKRQMQRLKDLGYRTVGISEAIERFRSGDVTESCIVITFDDGYADFYRNAFPELARHGFTASVFLPTKYIGASRLRFKDKDCLTWNEIRELRRNGISFGSHTVTHPQLSTLKISAVAVEIVDSKHTIENNLGESIDSFAYPFAFPETKKDFIHALRNVLVNSGYQHGVSTRIGTARPQDDLYFLRRLPINSLDDFYLFDAKLAGGYDWLHAVQYGIKLVRN